MPQQAPSTMMMMPTPQQQQQMMYQSVQMPQQPSSYMPQNLMYPIPQHGMSFGYHPMMQQTRMIPRGMPMPMMANTFAPPSNNFPTQPSFFNPMGQQLVY